MTKEEKIENLNLSDISRNPYQPRIQFDEEKLEELARSIQTSGLLQPIIVRKSKIFGYELLAGERRFLASKKAGIPTIPAIIRDYNDQDMMTLSILENLQREDLNPVEEAKSLKNLQEKGGLKQEEIAQLLGKSRSYVSNLIRILALPKELLYLVEKGSLSPAHARTLLSLESEIQQLDLARQITKKRLSVREVEKLVYQSVTPTPPTQKSNSDIYTEEIEQRLKGILGNTVQITHSKLHQGQIKINFDNLNQLEKIIQKLEK